MVKKLYSRYEKIDRNKKKKKFKNNFIDYLSLSIYMVSLSIFISIFIYLTAGNYTDKPSIIFIGYIIGFAGGILSHILFPSDNIYSGLILAFAGIIITFIISFYFSIYPYYAVFKGSFLSLVRLYILNRFYLKSLIPAIFIYFLTFNSGYYSLAILKK